MWFCRRHRSNRAFLAEARANRARRTPACLEASTSTSGSITISRNAILIIFTALLVKSFHVFIHLPRHNQNHLLSISCISVEPYGVQSMFEPLVNPSLIVPLLPWCLCICPAFTRLKCYVLTKYIVQSLSISMGVDCGGTWGICRPPALHNDV